MSPETETAVRKLLADMTEAANAFHEPMSVRRDAIRDFSEAIAAQVRTPCLPTLDAPKPFFDERGHLWV